MAVVVCVTGAGGFIGSWIVKLLLARGYAVRGTSRRADDPKNAHLWALDGAAERLTMVQVDLLDRASLRAAFDGCDGVIHTASPMHDNPEEIIEPVITGTRNVVEVAADVGVRRVVLSSTIGTMYMDPRRDPDAPLDESCWSDLDYCKNTKNWYCYAKTIAERGAWDVARARGLDLVVVIPVVVLGEMLQSGMNTSTRHILKYLTGEAKTYVNESHAYVHVRDAAEAHVRVLEASEARGRYVCAERTLHRGELCRILAELFPEYPIPTRGWTLVAAGDHKRHVNGILGLLCRLHFPGLVEFGGGQEPAYTWDHYVAFPDLPDRDGRVFANKAARVTAELWDFFRCQEGYEAKAASVAHKACYKLVKDMHYEARVQAIVTYKATYLGLKINKTEARNMRLTREEYIQVPPWWCAQHLQCWAQMVDKWCAAEWEETHNACRERRLMMPGAPHHQGNRSLDEFAATWSSSHGGQPCSQFKAWALAHKGKATSNVDYNPEDPPSVYSNATVHSRLSEYTSMARAVHGPKYDPSAQDLDGEVVMRVGGGKKHGRYWIGDSTLDTATTPTLSQIRARSTSSSPAIRPRPDTAQSRMEALQAQLEEEKRLREEMSVRMEADQQRNEAERQRNEAERQRNEAERQRMEQMFQWMQSLGERMGQPLPPELFPPPPPPATTPNQSAASNDVRHGSSHQSGWPTW